MRLDFDSQRHNCPPPEKNSLSLCKTDVQNCTKRDRDAFTVYDLLSRWLLFFDLFSDRFARAYQIMLSWKPSVCEPPLLAKRQRLKSSSQRGRSDHLTRNSIMALCLSPAVDFSADNCQDPGLCLVLWTLFSLVVWVASCFHFINQVLSLFQLLSRCFHFFFSLHSSGSAHTHLVLVSVTAVTLFILPHPALC